VSKKALLALCLAIAVPLVSYVLVKHYGDEAVVMPRRFYEDSVITKITDGKETSDTIWHQVRNITLTNQLGRAVSLGQLRGKIIVADFFFTHCGSICPALTANMKKMQDAVVKQDNIKYADTSFVQFLSFSVDPERDSVPVLKKYADKYAVNHDTWWMLTGPKKEIYDFALNELKMGLVDGEGVDSNFIHTQKMVLMDKDHVVRGYYNGLDSADLSKLANDIVFIMLEKDKNYVSPLQELKPMIPMIIIIIIVIGTVIYFLFRQPRYPVKKKEVI